MIFTLHFPAIKPTLRERTTESKSKVVNLAFTPTRWDFIVNSSHQIQKVETHDLGSLAPPIGVCKLWSTSAQAKTKHQVNFASVRPRLPPAVCAARASAGTARPSLDRDLLRL